MNTPKCIIVIAILCAVGLLAPQPNTSASAAPQVVDCDAPNIVCVGGTLDEDATWTADNVYVIDGLNLTIASDTTLTIEAGTVIKADLSAMLIEGTLNTTGTAAAPVIFTSLVDDSVGGDTENDGEPSGNITSWDNLQFLPGSVGNLAYTELYYFSNAGDRRGGIYNEGGTLVIDNVTFARDQALGAEPITTNIENIPEVSNLTFENMLYSGLHIRGSELTTDVTIPKQDVIYYLTNGDLTVKENATLTIDAGAVFKARRTKLKIEGALVTDGTASEPVIFTSYYDDRLGGDSDSDGFVPSTGPGAAWEGISFSPNSRGTLNGIVMHHAIDGITTDAAEVSIQNCILSNNIQGLNASENLPLPTITNCDIYGNANQGVKNTDIDTLDAANNWWGHWAGPHDPFSPEVDGIKYENPFGDKALGDVSYAPWIDTKRQPELILDRSEIVISATAGGKNPSTIPVALTHGAELLWQASTTEPWATASNAGDEMQIEIDTSDLAPGDYEAIAIAQWGESAIPRFAYVALKLSVLAPETVAPELMLDKQGIHFFGRETIQAPAPEILNLTNVGSGTLEWSASTTAPWLTISPSSGTADAKIELTADITGLTEGIYESEIVIESPNATNGPLTVNTSLTIGCSNPQPMDIALVTDRANTGIGGLDATKDAIFSFLELLDLTRDQVALIPFSRAAAVSQPLSQDALAIATKLFTLTDDSRTRFETGMPVGQGELQSERHIAGNLPVMILLSDVQNGLEDIDFYEAFRVKAAGTYIVTIGMGDADEDEELKQLASFESDYYLARDADDLIRIYNRIATTVSCNVTGTGVEQIYIPVVQK